MGLGIGIGMIFGLEQIDTTFKSIEEMQEYLNIPAVGMIPSIVISTEMNQKVKSSS